MTPDTFIQQFGSLKASAILRTDDQEKAALAMEAAIRGGFRIIEFTLTVPGVFDLVRDFSQREDLVVGTGTVMDVEQAQQSVEAGARFLVSPVVDEAVIGAANELGVASMPGTHTPTEMLRAHRAGAQLCKLFPCPHGGPTWVRSCWVQCHTSTSCQPMALINTMPANGSPPGSLLAASWHPYSCPQTLLQDVGMPSKSGQGNAWRRCKRIRRRRSGLLDNHHPIHQPHAKSAGVLLTAQSGD